MNREERRTDAGLKPQAGVVALFREDEFLGLAVEAVAKGKSGKFHAQPLRHQTGGERVLHAPGCHRLHREGIARRKTQQLGQEGACRRANLHPQLQRGARLLPEVADTPPALQIVKQRLYSPAARIQAHDGFGRQLGLRGQQQAGFRPGLLLGIEELAPDGTHGVPLRKRANATTERSRSNWS